MRFTEKTWERARGRRRRLPRPERAHPARRPRSHVVDKYCIPPQTAVIVVGKNGHWTICPHTDGTGPGREIRRRNRRRGTDQGGKYAAVRSANDGEGQPEIEHDVSKIILKKFCHVFGIFINIYQVLKNREKAICEAG